MITFNNSDWLKHEIQFFFHPKWQQNLKACLLLRNIKILIKEQWTLDIIGREPYRQIHYRLHSLAQEPTELRPDTTSNSLQHDEVSFSKQTLKTIHLVWTCIFYTVVKSVYVLSCCVAMYVIYVRPNYTTDIALKSTGPYILFTLCLKGTPPASYQQMFCNISTI